jgi:AcrR family transcriptional regulator
MARSRSEDAHNKVVEAAAKLFAERGIESTSMDAISRSSGVSKATIYRHWADKDTLCLEVMLYLHGLDKELPVFDSGDLRADIIAQLRYDPAEDRKALRERIIPHLMAYAAHNRVFGDAWRSQVLLPVRTSLRALIERGKGRGELRADLDIEVGLALLLGPMIYQKVFVYRLGGKVPEDMEAHVAQAFLGGFGVDGKHS